MNKILSLLFLGICSSLFALSPAEQMVGNVWRANLARTGEFPFSGPEDQPELKWRFKTGGKVLSSPLVVEGKVFVGSNDKKVYCLDFNTGSELWSYNVGQPLTEAGAVYDGKVFFASQAGVIAIDIATGKKIWENRRVNRSLAPLVLPGPIKTKSGTIKGLVFASIPWQALVGLDTENGHEIWRCRDNNGSGNHSSPTLHRGNIFFTNGSQGIRAVDLLTERQKGFCDQGIDNYHFTTAARDGKLVSLGKGVFVIDAEKFQDKYFNLKSFNKSEWDFRHPYFSSPAMSEDAIFIGNADGFMYAVDLKTMQSLWQFETQGAVLSSPALSKNGNVYFGSKDGNVYGLKAESGKELWRYKTGGPVISSPAIYDGAVVIGSEDGYIYALQ